MSEHLEKPYSEYGPFKSPEQALEVSRKRLESDGYVFLERYIGKKKLSKNPDSRIFDIYFIETEQGFVLYAQTTSANEFKIIEGEIHIVSWLGRFGGRYELALASVDLDPRNFLDITEDIHDIPTVVSDIYVEVPGYGLGSKMLDMLCKTLEKKKCVHIVAFSELGLLKLSEHYLAHHYKDVIVVDREKESKIYRRGPLDLSEPARYLGWMYRIYRNGEKKS